MEREKTEWNVHVGDDVLGADGGKIGTVIAIHPKFIVVEKGFFYPTDYYIPTSAVAAYDGKRIRLTMSKEETLHQGWDRQPTDDTGLTIADRYLPR